MRSATSPRASFTERYRTIVSAGLLSRYGDEDREYTWRTFRAFATCPEPRSALVSCC